MRWIFGFLVLANIGLFLWGLWYREPLVDEVIPAPRRPVAEEKMKLLTEPGAQLTLHAPAPVSARPPNAATAVSGCYHLGPFTGIDKARAAGVKLDGWGLAYTRIAEFETGGPAYRVYLPPLSSPELAERKLRELSNLGFTDHALIQQEEGMENAISLGLFNVEQNARARVELLGRKGVKASIQPIPNVRPVYWLALLEASADGRVGGVELTRFGLEDWGTANVVLRPVPCAGVPQRTNPEVTRPSGRR